MGDLKTVVLFGGGGFIGHRLAIKLAAYFHVVVADNFMPVEKVDWEAGELDRRRKALVNTGVTVLETDICNVSGIQAALHGKTIDTAIHLAGTSTVSAAYENGEDEICGVSQNILSILALTPPTRIIYFSSSMVYGDFCHTSINEQHPKEPVDRYGAYKLMNEVLIKAWCSEHKTKCIILRPTAVYGERDVKQRVVTKFIESIRNDLASTIVDDSANLLDFTYVDDVVDASVLATNYSESADFNIAYGEGRSLLELSKLLGRVGAKFNELVVENTLHATAKRGSLNCDKAIKLLGFNPKFSLVQGLEKTLQHELSVGLGNTTDLNDCKTIPFARAEVFADDYDELIRVAQSGWLTSGDRNKVFEHELLAFLHAEQSFAVSCNSCASALTVALMAANITGEVIVPAFTFSATVNAIILAGATPVFVDVDPFNLGLIVDAMDDVLSVNTQAVLAVHLAGGLCDIELLAEFSKQNNLMLIEDCAQALGAERAGRFAGTFGEIACFSFFPTKLITTGEGGMVVTKHAHIHEKAVALINHGYLSTTLDREQQLKPWKKQQQLAGFNLRLSNLNAALGLAQLRRLPAVIEMRRTKGRRLVDQLESIPSISVLEYVQDESVFLSISFLVHDECYRDDVVLKLRSRGVLASVHYSEVLPYTQVFAHLTRPGQIFSNAQHIANHIVTVPFFTALTEKEIDRIGSAVADVMHEVLNNDTRTLEVSLTAR